MFERFLAVFFVLTVAGWGQVREGEVVGRVNLASGGSPGVVFLEVRDLDGRVVTSGLTDEQGSFRLAGVPRSDPDLTLVVEHDGFEPVSQPLNVIQAQGALTIVYLTPETDANAVPVSDRAAVNGGGVLAEVPDTARDEYERALEDREDGNLDEAMAHLEAAVELAPDFYDAWIELGGAFLELRRFEDGENAYQKAREANPSGLLGALNLGVLHYMEGEAQDSLGAVRDAAESFERGRIALIEALQIEPFSVDARFHLGATLYKLGVYDEAERMLQDTLEIEAAHRQARLMLLNVYSRQARYEAALEQAVAFLEENPEAPERSAIERAKSQIEAALEH